MTSFESMCGKLQQTGLYDISEESVIYAELMAYAEGFDIFYNAVDELFRECFVSTAESYGLTLRENMLRRFNLDTSVIGRRNALIKALSVNQSDYTYSGMNKIRDSFNVHGEFHNYEAQQRVVFRCTDLLSNTQQQNLESQMKMFMPCWIPFTLEMISG